MHDPAEIAASRADVASTQSTEEPPSTRSQVATGPLAECTEGPLEEALRLAARAGRWDVVAALAKELEERRHADAGNVVALTPKAKRRGGR